MCCLCLHDAIAELTCRLVVADHRPIDHNLLLQDAGPFDERSGDAPSWARANGPDHVKRQKNDAADAEAICEAVTRANMRFVATKTPEQQSCLMLHRTRHLFIRQQTAVINAIRAHLAEFGIVAPVGRNGVEQLLGIVADPNDKRLPEVARVCTEHHLIVTHEVTNTGSDRSQLANVASQAKDVLGADHLDVVADRGYFNGPKILACELADITVTLPKPMTSGAKSDDQASGAGVLP